MSRSMVRIAPAPASVTVVKSLHPPIATSRAGPGQRQQVARTSAPDDANAA
jgi:hypothetical protein